MDPVRPPVLTVSELNNRAKALIEGQLGTVLVRGELRDVRIYASGHLYFTLRDAGSQVAGVMWSSRVRRLLFAPVDGLQVVALVSPSIYAARGQFQVVADALRLEGEGDLQAAYERLKARLTAAGLFDPAAKRPLPRWPTAVALVTSADGAALRDLVRVIHGRAPWVRLRVCPSLVQGAEAPARLVAALELANRPDAGAFVLLARGGGSLEDLWAFNDEGLVRAIRASRLPVVAAVGHETDWTLADLAADLRMATPSHAGTLVPDGQALREGLLATERRLVRSFRAGLAQRRLELMNRTRLLEAQDPRVRLLLGRQRLEALDRRLGRSIRSRLQQDRARLGAGGARLAALSPLAVLGRGYGLVRREDPAGPLVLDAATVEPGARLHISLAQGALQATVTASLPGSGS